jgi:hypothetical protein
MYPTYITAQGFSTDLSVYLLVVLNVWVFLSSSKSIYITDHELTYLKVVEQSDA